MPLKDIENWFLLISAEVHQASYLCQVIMIRFSRSNALMLADIAKKLQNVIQNNFCSIIFTLLFVKLKYAEETNICIALFVLKIDSWLFTMEPTKPKRTSQTAQRISEVSVLATSMHTTHTAQWKMVFEHASVETANCLALS